MQALLPPVVIESGGSITEDSSWLQPVHEDRHINLAELDAVLRGVNLALPRKPSVIHRRTYSACVHHWISDTLSEKTTARTKAASEILIRDQELASEYGVEIDIMPIKSHENRTDQFTRITQQWLDESRKKIEPLALSVAAPSNGLESIRIRNIHQVSGHPSVKHTLYFIRMISPGVPKTAVQEVARNCDKSQSIDPAPVHWKMVEDEYLDVRMD